MGPTDSAVTVLQQRFDINARNPALDWTAAEAALKAPIPDDYKELLDVFGAANFCGGIGLLHPSTNPNWDMVTATYNDRQLLVPEDNAVPRPARLPDDRPFDRSALITWGGGSGGEYWLWVPDPDAPTEPDRYIIVLTPADQADWWFFEGPTAGFIQRWIEGVTPAPDEYYNVAQLLDDGEPPFVETYDDDGTRAEYTARG